MSSTKSRASWITEISTSRYPVKISISDKLHEKASNCQNYDFRGRARIFRVHDGVKSEVVSACRSNEVEYNCGHSLKWPHTEPF